MGSVGSVGRVLGRVRGRATGEDEGHRHGGNVWRRALLRRCLVEPGSPFNRIKSFLGIFSSDFFNIISFMRLVWILKLYMKVSFSRHCSGHL